VGAHRRAGSICSRRPDPQDNNGAATALTLLRGPRSHASPPAAGNALWARLSGGVSGCRSARAEGTDWRSCAAVISNEGSGIATRLPPPLIFSTCIKKQLGPAGRQFAQDGGLADEDVEAGNLRKRLTAERAKRVTGDADCDAILDSLNFPGRYSSPSVIWG